MFNPGKAPEHKLGILAAQQEELLSSVRWTLRVATAGSPRKIC